MKLAKIPQLGAQVSAKGGQAAAGFGAALDKALSELVAPAPKKSAKTEGKPDKKAEKKPDKKPDKKPHEPAAAVVAQLAHAQALVPLAPVHAPHAKKHHHGPAEAATSLKAAAPAERRAPVEPPAPTRELSAQPAAIFTLTDAPRETPKAPAPAPPAWLPREVAADDTARLTVFPHAANLTAEGHALHLQVRDGEVTLRVRGELAAQLRSSESELRVALAQEGLKLRESTFTPQQRDGDRRREQHQPEREDEWT